jgi:hypothetical protein
MKRVISIFALVIIVFGFHSCEKYEIVIGSDFKADIEPIFVGSCSACHPSLIAPDFTEGKVYTSLTQHKGGGLLDMDLPEESLVLVKATDGHGSDISPNQKEAIIKWITNGALQVEVKK